MCASRTSRTATKNIKSTWTPEEIVERLKDATIAIINKVPMRADTLKQLPKLKLIAVAATGTDVVDKAYCKANGITVVNIRNYAFNTVPEHVMALMFALRRNLLAYIEDVRNGRWGKVDQFCFFDHPIRDIAGSTIGHRRLWRHRQVGRQAGRGARHAHPALRRVAAAGPGRFRDDADGERRHHLAHAAHARAPRTCSARRAQEDEADRHPHQYRARRPGRRGGAGRGAEGGTIAGAGFDVLTKEPPKEGNVLLDLKLPNLIVTPHVAWASVEAMQILADQLIDNVEAFVAGKPQNVVQE